MSEDIHHIHPMLTRFVHSPIQQPGKKSIDLAEEALSIWLKNSLIRLGRFILSNDVFIAVQWSSWGICSRAYCWHSVKAIPAFAFSTYKEQRLLGPQTLVIGISTTGETQSVCKGTAYARQAGSSTLAITAHQDLAITHNADFVILTGGEDDQISVKTKSYVQALIPMYVLAICLAR